MNIRDQRSTKAADHTTSPEQELRRRAEALAWEKATQAPQNLEALSSKARQDLLHELQVHQIELELQNEELRSSQAELDTARAHYFDLYELAPVGYLILGEQGLILEANLTAATLLGVARSALLKQPFNRFILRRDQQIYYRHRRQLFESGDPQVCELRLLKPDGAVFWAYLQAFAAQDEDETPFCRVVISDITARYQAEEVLQKASEELDDKVKERTTELVQVNDRLQEKDALLQKLSENVPGMIYQYQYFPDGRSCFPYSSAGIRNIYEVHPEEVRHDATKVYQRLHPDDYDGVLASIMESFHTLQQWTYEYRVLLPKKGERWIKGSATPEKLDDGSVLWHGEITDITERKRAEQALQEAYRRMDEIIECSPDATVVVDQTGTVIAWNKAMEEMTLVSKKEMLGKSNHEYAIPFYGKRQPILLDLALLGEEEFARVKDQYDQIHWSGDTLFGEVYCPETYGGKGAYLWASATRLRDASGNIFGAIESIRDITDRKEAEEERIARQTAEAANRTKSEFLANMSHEIRTPINVIMGMTEIVYNSELNKEQKEYLGMVRDSTASLLTIINDILNFSKIEAGRLELEVEDFNLYEKVEQTTATFALQAYQKGLELLLFIQPDVPQTVRGDPARLRQILINLLGNAHKFTDAGEIILSLSKGQAGPGEIQDTAAPAQPGSGASQQTAGPVSEMLIFSIKDTGAGIPREKQALLFERFSQVDSSSTRRQEGTGLGLAISKKLVELMGGSIGVESEAGRGSTFTFRVPLCLPVAAAAEELPATPEHFSDVQVLVIDDNKASRLIIKDMLQSRGLTVQTAPGGREGLEMMRHHATKGEPFDLLVLDQQMPGMDGFQVTEQINREKLLQGATLIMLSSVDTNVNAAGRDALGLSSYLVKPVKPSELFSRIHAALYKAKQQKPIREGEVPIKTAEADQVEQPEAGQGKKLQILLVEDKPMNRKLATTLLEKKGWIVTETFHGRQALEMLATRSFDLVLMDIQMPEMDGIEATRRIRAGERETGGHLPIIAMTAHAIKGDRDEFMAAGMDGYVSKPINAEELYRAVKEAAAAQPGHGKGP